MMTSTQQDLLDILKSNLFNVPLSLTSDFTSVLREAEDQMVLPLAFPSQNNLRVLQIQSHFAKVVYEQSRLVNLFNEYSIPIVILKGTAAAMYYPEPRLRTMGDVDFITTEFEKAREILRNNRYVFQRDFGDDRDYEYVKGGVVFELHHRYSNNEAVEKSVQDGIKRAVACTIKGYQFPCLPPAENGLVILDHIRHHFKTSGLGLRHLIDWMMYAHTVLDDKFWESEFQLLARDTGLERLAIVLTATCRKWLGMPDDYEWCKGVDNDLIDQTIETFLNNGNFGRKQERENHKVEGITIAVKRDGWFKVLQSTGERTWNALKKYPWLRPFSWIYQSFRYARRGVIAMFRGANFGKEIYDGKVKEEFYNKLGL